MTVASMNVCYVLARLPISVCELKSSASNAAGQNRAFKHSSHAVIFHYHWVIIIKLRVLGVKCIQGNDNQDVNITNLHLRNFMFKA